MNEINQETGEPIRLADVIKLVNDWARSRDVNIVRISGQPATAWTAVVAHTAGGGSHEVCERSPAAIIDKLDTWYAAVIVKGEPEDDAPEPTPEAQS